jgi:hypothetical protein
MHSGICDGDGSTCGFEAALFFTVSSSLDATCRDPKFARTHYRSEYYFDSAHRSELSLKIEEVWNSIIGRTAALDLHGFPSDRIRIQKEKLARVPEYETYDSIDMAVCSAGPHCSGDTEKAVSTSHGTVIDRASRRASAPDVHLHQTCICTRRASAPSAPDMHLQYSSAMLRCNARLCDAYHYWHSRHSCMIVRVCATV